MNSKRKDALMQGLAFIGVLALLVLFIWGGMQIVRSGFVFSAFNNISSNLSAAIIQLTSVFKPDKGNLIVVSGEENFVDLLSELVVPGDGGIEVDGEEAPAGDDILSGGLGSGGDAISGGELEPAAGEKTEQLVQFVGKTDVAENPNGKADLGIHVLGTGILDPETNTFTTADIIKTTDRGAVQFEVTNLGTKTSEEWTFNAVLPTNPPHTFNSDNQQVLAPGERIEFTLGFDAVVHEEEGVITITVDPDNNIEEVTKENNSVKTTIQIEVVEN